MKFIIKLGLVFLISWIIYLVPKNFLTRDFFKIKEIEIQGNSKILSTELTELAYTLYNSNTWEVNLTELEKYLKRDVRIKDAEIKIVGLGKVRIKIQERELQYYSQIQDNIYLVDQNGVVFGFLKEKDGKETFFLTGENEEQIKELLKIEKALDNYILKNIISQIYIKDKNCIEIVLIDGTIIKTNFEVEKEKYRVVESLYYELVKTKKIEYIDLRFNDYIVKGLGDKNNGK